MALSNILNEPRREITETLIGLVPIVALLYCDYRFALWFQAFTGGPEKGCPWPGGLLIGLLIFMFGLLLLLAIHFVGEEICDALANRGFDPRPKVRR